MFVEVMERIKQEVVELVFRMQLVRDREFRGVFESVPQKTQHEEFKGLARRPSRKKAAEDLEDVTQEGHEEAGTSAPVYQGHKVGRNMPCPCGSGKKYKKCCGR